MRSLAAMAVAGALALAPAAGAEADTDAGASEPAPDDPADRLLASFAHMPGLYARFRETKHLSLLREPLVSRGSLYFAPPDRLLRRVEAPVRSALLVHGSRLALSGPAGTRTLDLAATPVVRALVDGFRLILAGDRAGLDALYAVELDRVEGGSWRLELVPRSPELRRAVASLVLDGRGLVPRELRVLEAGGDESVTRFTEVDAARRFDARELAELFQLPAP